MIASTRSRIADLWRAAAPLVVLASIGAVLVLFPPGQYSFYPQCPIHRYLGIQCPGCGTTRALAALLRGDIVEALRLNALTTLLAPVAAVYASLCYWRFLERRPVHLPRLPRPMIYAALVVAVLFTIGRNVGHI